MPPDAIAFTGTQIIAGAGVLVAAIVALFGTLIQVFRAQLKEVQALTRQEVDAWEGRAKRAESQVDTLLPAVEKVLADRGGRTQ